MIHCVKVNPEGRKTSPAVGREIRFIVVHYTAGSNSKAGRVFYDAVHIANSEAEQSADFFVDDEFVAQFNPDLRNRYSWHCKGRTNNLVADSMYGICTNENSIGVEICSTNQAGEITFPGDMRYSFTDAVLENAAELIRMLMAEYRIDISHVVRHYDVNGKLCPGVPGWFGPEESSPDWTEFRKRLTDETGQTGTPAFNPDAR